MEKEKFEIGDLLLITLKGNHSIVEIDDIDLDDTQCTYNFNCLYGIYSQADGWICNKDYNIIKKVDTSFVDKFFEDSNLHKIGSKVYFDGEEDFIKSYDRNGDEYYLENYDDWVSSSDIEIELVNESTFKVGDLVKNDGIIYKISDIDSDGDYHLDLIIGNFKTKRSYLSKDNLESATQEDIEFLQKDSLFKIGEKVLCSGKETTITAIDTDKNTSRKFRTDYWAYDDHLKKLVSEITFKVGDLVKIKNEGNSILKVVEIYSLTNIHTELIIGEVGDEGSYESSDLELTTQEELNRFQQGYLFKIGDKVLYDDEIDIIKSIDMNDDEQTYLLLNADDWVAEYDISPFTESEKSDEVVKVVESPKVEPDKVEPTIKTTKKRILLGAC